MPTFAEYLEKWLKQSTQQGLTNPLVKMPVKRFRLLQRDEISAIADGGTLTIGTMSEPIARNLQKNYLTRIRERGERCAFVCFGSVEMIIAGGTDGKQRKQLFPVCLKRASFQTSGDKIKAVVDEDDVWQFNPVLQAHLRGLTIIVPEAEAEDFGVSESLLEEFGGVFEEDKTQVMLMSHYRSETPDLIRFSNDWFYGGKLEMYPPAHVTGIGRRLHYLPNAIYNETGLRNNPTEANEVVKLIELHVREHPEKSLGVVTMNISQMELIEELLLNISETVRAFCSDESKFFLRNLETVQGDEMDRIILSLTYGKNPNGQFNAAVLGPLNKSGGERRLNVAITRSRNGMTIVSSLKVADLLATNAQSRGFNCLKDFLGELENTEQARTFGIGSKRFERKNDGVSNIVYCESPFEEQVMGFLENEGFDIECQYGAGKYRLDIIVKERGKNILAIECDGAAYHSSLVARTRDRARQRVLERLGWKIHRVWSTNWWHFEQQEKDGIIAAINAARGIKR